MNNYLSFYKMKSVKLLLLLSLICNVGLAQNLKLILAPSIALLLEGKPIILQLKIEGLNEQILNQQKGNKIKYKQDLSTKFTITPHNGGELVIGPYSMEINNKTLTSNQLKVTILNERPKDIVYLVTPLSAKRGETVYVNVLTTNPKSYKISPKQSKNYSFKKGSEAISSQFIDGEKVSKVHLQFVFTFNEKGIYDFTNEIFENIPNGVSVEAKKIRID